MEIYDKKGNLIATSEPPDTRIFDNMVIRDASLAGRDLEVFLSTVQICRDRISLEPIYTGQSSLTPISIIAYSGKLI